MINFKLKHINEIISARKNVKEPLSLYTLMDGYLWLKFDDITLFEYTKEAIVTFEEDQQTRYSDYYLLRFILDFSELFKSICIPISKQLYDLANDLPQFLQDSKKWLDMYDTGSDDDYPEDIYEQYLKLNSWLGERTMDSGHLLGGPHLSFLRFENKIKIVWRTEHNLENGIRLWTAKNGFHEMNYIDFVENIKVFFQNFYLAIEKQLEDVCKSNVYNINIDKNVLLEDQQHVKGKLAKDVSLLEKDLQNKANWKAIEVLIAKMRYDLSKPLIWQLLETNAPARFEPYSNLEEKQFPSISVRELFRLRKIKKDYLIALLDVIKAELQVEMQTEFDSFGSGYASFVSVFLFRPQDVVQENQGGGKEIDGVLIYISSEVPAYIFGKYTLYDANCLQFQLPSEELEEELDEFWRNKMAKLNTFMENLNFKHLNHDLLKQEPDFACSLFTDIPYDGFFNESRKTRIFDLFFHWAS